MSSKNEGDDITSSYSVGSLVWVTTSDDTATATESSFFRRENPKEAGIVMKVGCAYSYYKPIASSTDSESEIEEEEVCCNDGIMVKLQVSNSRRIYPPSRISPLEEDVVTKGERKHDTDIKTPQSFTANSRATRSRFFLRRQVTPSPPNVDDDNNGRCNESQEMKSNATNHADKSSNMDSDKKEDDENDEDDDDDIEDDDDEEFRIKRSWRGKSNKTTTTTTTSEVIQKPISVVARVECANSTSRAKCNQCKSKLEKGILRIQKLSSSVSKKNKNPWFHIDCFPFEKVLATTQDDTTTATSITTTMPPEQLIDGYLDLSPDNKRIFKKKWLSISTSSSSESNNGSNDNKNDDDIIETASSNEDVADDKPLISLKRKKTAPKTSTSKSPKSSLSNTKKENTATKKKITQNKSALIFASDSSDDNDDDMNDDDDDPNIDRPFKVEYSPSGRATCRTCDERIVKDSLRVCHQPLFRGQPGFMVYRHLHCAIFGEEVTKIQHVGGWKKLKKKADKEALIKRIKESQVEVQKEKEELQPDELVQAMFQGEIRSGPPGLTGGTLLPFQVEGTSWMYHQEKHVPDIRGGILADEMGMGKTIQTIATILDNRPKLQRCKPGMKHPPSAVDIQERMQEESLWKDGVKCWSNEMKMANVPNKLLPKPADKASQWNGGGARAGTLVVCPVIALTQWKQEIEKFTNVTSSSDDNTDDKDTKKPPPILSIGIYHGPNRVSQNPRQLLRKYDVVLTTYQVLEADFRKMVSPNKVKCPNCGGKFKIDKLRIHLKYFCGEGAQRTEAQARQRRTADRHGSRQGGGGGRRGGNNANKQKLKSTKNTGKTKKSFQTPSPKTKSKKNASSKSSLKRIIRVKSTGDYESDSDLSISEDIAASLSKESTSRPSRMAAKTASQRMSESAKEWGNTAPSRGGRGRRNRSTASSDSDDAYESNDYESSSDDDDSSVEKNRSFKKSRTTKTSVPSTPSNSESIDSDNSSSSSSEDDAALQRARKKQRIALILAKKNKQVKKNLQKKKTFKPTKGKNENGGARKKPMNPVGGRKRKKPADSSSSSDSEESSEEDDNDRDPLDGIDLDKLMKEAMAGSQISILHSLCWWRVVLDEAHMIKSRSSQTSAAAFSLTSIHRWCLSGTPLQNRVGELYSLIRFLRIDPMAHYFCRKQGCDCKSLHYRMQHGKCQDCNHGSIQHFSHFNKHVLNPIQRDGYQGDGRRAMMKLKNEVMDKSLLRRTKQSRAEDMNLPPRVVNIRTIRLHPVEEDFYNALYTQTKSSFDDYVTEGTLLNNYAHIFDLLTKMRQAVDHPYLIVYSRKNMEQMNNSRRITAPLVANGSVDCDICSEPPTDRVVSSCCGAAFCRACVAEYMSPALENVDRDGASCPSCRGPFTIDLNQKSSDIVDDGILDVTTKSSSSTADMPSLKEMSHVASGSILRRINLAEFATSTKVEALVQELVQMRQERPGSKALVFSQFVNMLDLIRWRLHSDPCLQDLGLGVRIIHGGMNVQSRDSSLKDFREDNRVRVLLMSLKAGGVALNLTVANEAYLMDPWWNPAAEMQAIDRTHRLGQYRPIRAVRFIAEGTVEERVLQLQEKKRLVFDGTVGRDAASLKMLTVNDMKSLFT